MNPTSSIHWITQDLDDCPGGNNWFSAREIAILDGLRFVKRRSDWRLGRWTSKTAIQSYYKQSHNLGDIEILPDNDGSPRAFIKSAPVPFSISISHSHSIAMCCLYPEGLSLGCDIEYIEERSLNFIADYFTKEEMNLVTQSAESKRNIIANLIWSAKESGLKSLREGLRLDTRSVEVSYVDFDNSFEWFPIKLTVYNKTDLHGWARIGERFVQTVACEKQTAKPVKIL